MIGAPPPAPGALRTEDCGECLDRGLAELKRSLAQLAAAQGGPPAPLPRGAARLLEALGRRPAAAGDPDPLVWLAYYRIGHPQAGSESLPFPWGEIPARLAELADRPSPAGQVVAWGDPSLYSAAEWEAILALFQEGGDFVADLDAPDPETVLALRRAAGQVRALLQRLPDGLGASLDRLLALTILARPGPLARRAGSSFGGATAFFLRGASVIHASPGLTFPGLLERLVHECAHAELFVLAQDGPLCSNPDDERHPVLIRRDPRPMNGILHSLHVTGRVCETLDALLADGLPERADREPLLHDFRQLRTQQEQLGRSSLEATRRFGRLTPLGLAVCETAARRLAGIPEASR
ncbi:MAG: aKG-HExxH-type peptide beta-hydroxylase [Synechococcaceae cyanobacterium]